VTISDDERKAFADAMSGVRPLKPANQARLDRPRPPARAGFSRAAREAILEQSLKGPIPIEAGEDVAFCRESVTRKTFRRLRRGEFAIEAEIDLHGMRLAEARAALLDFLRECAVRDIGCVRVVHGKGTRSGPDGPILKPGVHHWLARADQVLAFVTAQPRHGGSGAIYVLLRRR
jgi:DNA-nicking Smr family endonuclease